MAKRKTPTASQTFHPELVSLRKRLFSPQELPPECALHLPDEAVLAFLFRQARRFDLEFGEPYDRTDQPESTERDDNGAYYWSSSFTVGSPDRFIEVVNNAHQGEQMIYALPYSETRIFTLHGLTAGRQLIFLFSRETMVLDLRTAYLQIDVTAEAEPANLILTAFTETFSQHQGWIDTPLSAPWKGFELCWNCGGDQVCPHCNGEGVRRNGGLELPCEHCDESAPPAWCTVCAGAGQWPKDPKQPFFTPGYLRTWPGNIPRVSKS